MHDIRLIRENPEAFDAGLARRGPKVVADALSALNQTLEDVEALSVAEALLMLHDERRALTTKLQQLEARRNDASKLIGASIAKGDNPAAEALKSEVSEIKSLLLQVKLEEGFADEDLQRALALIPNLPATDVPDGASEEDNRVESEWGEKRAFDFTPKEHADIAPALGMDFETGARLSGARFTFLRGGMARLHRALGQFMLDVQTGEHGYAECNPPVLVKDLAMYGTDKLPKFAEDSFFAADMSTRSKLFWDAMPHFEEEMALAREGERRPALEAMLERADTAEQFWLIPTSEVSLTASVMGELLDEAALPMRLTALTLCFRSEAGAAGRDTRGFIRQHQFEKCELVSIVRPEDSESEHQRMVRAAETILERLALPYRKLLLCTGDMGFGARKTYDLEVWLPGQGAYREISSCSNCGDFQARRMQARWRNPATGKPEPVHTLNGSGVAVGRALIAVMENYQNADGSIDVPGALRPYMGGVERIA